ncbi:hypothetical protein QBC46DRAFT_393363 [Diplogelasinospora grovesii]|uniref:Zn(2)-C6 fungal-type domain-containing protein n=1 Tax=Diplogelasinospora grovesii TaxID=303347 RepID=A0AAN6S224_9PEZI|nr:hypothetical protein QBC46DRAFT_393363 [Diplogelasinospora grovesii]
MARLPSLLPRPETGRAPPTSTTQLPARRRAGVSVACNTCRAKKQRCDGQRPKCSSCVIRNWECSYDRRADERQKIREEGKRLEITAAEAIRLFEILKSKSAPVANDALRSIRDGQVPQSIIRAIDGAVAVANLQHHSLPRSPSPYRTAWPTQTQLESELANLHRNAFPPLPPLDVAKVDLKLIGIDLGAARDERESQLVSRDDPNMTMNQPGEPSGSGYYLSPPRSNLQSRRRTASPPLSDDDDAESPPAPRKYSDERLARIDMKRWTNVPVENDFAARAIQLYLKEELPLVGFLDPDRFLDDMVAGRTRFCSKLLVHALMAWACQAYAYDDKTDRAASFSFMFFDAAVRLWQDEAGPSSLRVALNQNDAELTTASAMMLLAMTANHLGRDKRGQEFLGESARICRRLLLVDLESEPKTPWYGLDFQDEDVRESASITAWSTFNWQTLHSFYFHQPPRIKRPPWLPIPKPDRNDVPQSPDDDQSMDGYSPIPPRRRRRRRWLGHMGHTFEALCKFWAIMHEMVWAYYTDDIHSRNKTIEIAERLYQKLLAWADQLPDDLARTCPAPQSQAICIHIWYHTAVLDLFRPFLDSPQPLKLATFSYIDSTPRAVFGASVSQLKRLIYIYRSTYEVADFSALYQSGLLYLINAILEDVNKWELFSENEAKFYFYLCIRAYELLALHVPVIGVGIVGGIYSIALKRFRNDSRIPKDVDFPSHALSILQRIQKRSKKAMLRDSKGIKSEYPIDLKAAQENLEAASMEKLAGEAEKFVMSNQGIITGDSPED